MYEVRVLPDLKREYNRLKLDARRGNKEAKRVVELYDKGFDKITSDVKCGQKIPRKKWPKHYIQKYGIDNLWKLNLSKYLRMIYTIIKEFESIGAVIEVLPHNEYNRRFGYD